MRSTPVFRTLPPLADRLAAGRPVLSHEQLTDITQRMLAMTTADVVRIRVTHAARVVTRLANGQILSADDGDTLNIRLSTYMSDMNQPLTFRTNQLDDSALQAVVHQAEAMMREVLHAESARVDAKQVPDSLVPVQLWHDETVRAMTTHRSSVISALLEPVAQARLSGAGFVGLMARSEAVLTKEGISVFYEETDSEVNLTARSLDGTSSGWGGQAARNWSQLDPKTIVTRAITTAQQKAHPVAVEPGRRTAILSATAVAQLTSHFDEAFDGERVASGSSPLSLSSRRYGGKLHQRIFDPRLTLRSDPADLEAGYCPYFGDGYSTVPMTWVENGVLTNLQYNVPQAMKRGKVYTAPLQAFRMSGGTSTTAEMSARCEEGIFVNRLSEVELVDQRSGLVTGVTRDGCYLIKHGKIEKAVKNFRILESPFFVLNKVEALGVPERVAFGYAAGLYAPPWPHPPVMVPPMMVSDFNFVSLADAV
jgi:predicted Zn-dependent protease